MASWRPYRIKRHYHVRKLDCNLPIAESIHSAREQGEYSECCSAGVLNIGEEYDNGEHLEGAPVCITQREIVWIGKICVTHMTVARPLGFHCRCLVSLAATGMLTEGKYLSALLTSLEASPSFEPAKPISYSSGSTDVKEGKLPGRQALEPPSSLGITSASRNTPKSVSYCTMRERQAPCTLAIQ